jgi:dynein heavy chain
MPAPEVFGMHDNCNITYAENAALLLLENILSMAPRSSGGVGKSKEEVIDELAENLLAKTPKPFDMEMMDNIFPTSYNESTNTVVKQEAMKYNRLLKVMLKNLPVLRKALKGLVVLSAELTAVGESIYNNQVPDMFAKVGPLSLMPLSFWTKDLLLRIAFIQNWIDVKKPTIFWLSGLFFPQAFFTGSMQNHARREGIEIDRLNFDYAVMDTITADKVDYHPEVGVHVNGIYLEGATWDTKEHVLTDAIPKELYFEMWPIHMIPKKDRKKPEGCYECPIYKTLARRGVLSTTGHSTNFVVMLSLPSKLPGSIWTVSGLAAFLALKTC